MKNKEEIFQKIHEVAEKYAAEELELIGKAANIDHGTGNDKGIGEVLDAFLPVYKKMGVPYELIDNPAGGKHLVGHIVPEKSTGKIVVSGHLDTVFREGDAEKHPFRIEGDTAYGLGTADCFGGVVVATYALRILKELGLLPDKEIVMIHNSDEETGSPSGQDVFKKYAKDAEAAFVFEGSREEGGVLTSRRGVAEGNIEVTGVETHAGLKFTEGHSAAFELARQMLQLESLSDPEQGLYYNVGLLNCPTEPTVVAPYASAGFHISPLNEDSCEKILNDMRYLEEHVFDKGCTVKANAKFIFPVMERTEGNVKLYQLVAEAGKELGRELPEQTSGGASDACFFTQMGIPSVDALGPYLTGIHTYDEHIRISSILEQTELFAHILLKL